jgi:hypothetical protein
MTAIRVDLESVQVTEGQGIGEGDFELRIQVQEGNNNVVWPSLNASAKVDKNGAAYTINQPIATYFVDSGTLSKKFEIDVTEIDKGTLGQYDYGQGTLAFELEPNMEPSTKSATIRLKRPNMGYQGQVKVIMTAQRA